MNVPTLNPFAQALADGNYSLIWLCDNCTIMHANGDGSGLTDQDREPLSEITTGDLALGWPTKHHAPGCSEADREEGCSCETIEFSWDTCDGCGETDAGTRHAAILVYVDWR